MSKDLKLSGYGKEIKRKKFPNNYYFLIIYPNFELSTKSVFQHYSDIENFNHKSKKLFFENIKIYNSLLFSAISLAPEIKDVLDNLKNFQYRCLWYDRKWVYMLRYIQKFKRYT